MTDTDLPYVILALLWTAALGIGGLCAWIAQRPRRNARACGHGYERQQRPYVVGVASRPPRMGIRL